MITENVSTLKIHKLTQAQYNRALESGNIEENEIYLTPDENTYATVEQLEKKAPIQHTHSISNINELQSTLNSIQTDVQGSMKSFNPEGRGVFIFNGAGIESGNYSVAMGYDSIARGDYSHAVGYNSQSGKYAHSEGYHTNAEGNCSHAEGGNTTATGYYSHAEGANTSTGEYWAHAEGYWTNASGKSSHAEGYYTTALEYQHAQGHYNNTANATNGVNSGTSTGTAFVIGNGTKGSTSNAFRVSYNGTPYSKSALTTTGCDYAEYFEWADFNPDAEDRRGYFVTLDGDKIKIAEPDDYILGIVSGHPSVIGNGDEDWMGRYVMDDFGDFVYEEFEYQTEIPVEVVNEETGEVTVETTVITQIGKKYKENPDYDPSIAYIQREDRPEWDAVGMLGVLSVRDDGTCQINGYCTVAEGGIATASESGYRVIKRVNDNIVKAIFR